MVPPNFLKITIWDIFWMFKTLPKVDFFWTLDIFTPELPSLFVIKEGEDGCFFFFFNFLLSGPSRNQLVIFFAGKN